jgi:hypothetical protein
MRGFLEQSCEGQAGAIGRSPAVARTVGAGIACRYPELADAHGCDRCRARTRPRVARGLSIAARARAIDMRRRALATLGLRAPSHRTYGFITSHRTHGFITVQRRKRYTKEQVTKILHQHAQGVPIQALVARFGVSRSTLRRWRLRAATAEGWQRTLEHENRSLRRRVGNLSADKTLLQRMLRRETS